MNIQRLLLVAIALALATAGFAYPNFNATTGIIAVPTAYTTPAGMLVGAADISFQDSTTLITRAIYGLSPNFEVGALLGLGEETSIGMTGKYRTPLFPGLGTFSVGLSLADSGVGSGYQLFFVGSRALAGEDTGGMVLLGTLGLTFTNFEDLTGILPFAGAELRLSEGFEIDAEFVLEAGDFNRSTFSLLARKRITDTWGAQLGFTNAVGFLATADSNLFFGASYVFGR